MTDTTGPRAESSTDRPRVPRVSGVPGVIVAVGANGSPAAVREAVTEAESRGCRLQVMHAVDLDGAADDVLDQAVRQAHVLADGRVSVTSTLHHGSVLAGVTAESARAQLLVIERHPTTPDRRRLRSRLISGSQAPVLCVPEDQGERPLTGSVSVGVHDTLTCGPLIDAAFEAATARGARLRILHVRLEADEGLSSRELATTLAASERATFDGEIDVSVVTGRPAALLLEAAASSDLLVLGRHHPYRPGGSQLGSLARRVLSRAACPVLLPTPHQSVASAAWVFATHLD